VNVPFATEKFDVPTVIVYPLLWLITLEYPDVTLIPRTLIEVSIVHDGLFVSNTATSLDPGTLPEPPAPPLLEAQLLADENRPSPETKYWLADSAVEMVRVRMIRVAAADCMMRARCLTILFSFWGKFFSKL
jgi:hypothetical protein